MRLTIEEFSDTLGIAIDLDLETEEFIDPNEDLPHARLTHHFNTVVHTVQHILEVRFLGLREQ